MLAKFYVLRSVLPLYNEITIAICSFSCKLSLFKLGGTDISLGKVSDLNLSRTNQIHFDLFRNLYTN